MKPKTKIKYVCTDAGGGVGEHGPHRFAGIEKGTEVERDNLLMLAPSPLIFLDLPPPLICNCLFGFRQIFKNKEIQN